MDRWRYTEGKYTWKHSRYGIPELWRRAEGVAAWRRGGKEGMQLCSP